MDNMVYVVKVSVSDFMGSFSQTVCDNRNDAFDHIKKLYYELIEYLKERDEKYETKVELHGWRRFVTVHSEEEGDSHIFEFYCTQYPLNEYHSDVFDDIGMAQE